MKTPEQLNIDSLTTARGQEYWQERYAKTHGETKITNRGGSMSFSSWLHNFFHNVSPHKVAGALAASKVTIDELGAIEKWTWLPQFDDAMTKAIAELNNWQTGDPKIEVVEALQAVQTVLGSVKGLNEKDEAVIAICTGAVESGIALFG